MAKILTDEEMGQIIYDATHSTLIIDDSDAYQHFLEGLADLICDNFGGDCGRVGASRFRPWLDNRLLHQRQGSGRWRCVQKL